MIDECLIERFKSLSVDDKLNFLAQMIIEIRHKVEATSTSQLRQEEFNVLRIMS